ncbi:hypothetical protein [Winogradskyella luteola]|uniref:Uncharacterized protein n=1 Tax=Winogradskyella luteola TaxID=2828330 RepID=A0A9X1JQR4_9FLAO|nr:hypothetical protein [Winogradskyella luteola]MBV7270099.1 hypothetical protein [Winogradskyella luteola]
MDAKTSLHEIQKITCNDDSCQKEFSVITSPIYTVVTRPTVESNLGIRGADTIEEGPIDDYIVVKCPCGKNTQRVYLKINKDE